jgi:transcriptional regulator with XRE-family HTH domain
MKCPYCKGSGEIERENAHCGMLIKTQRDAAGMTQADLAPLIGVSRAQLANIEAGRTPDLQISKLKAAAKALECDIKDLIP